MSASRTHVIALSLDGAAFLAGWRPETGVLFLPALANAQLGDAAAVRIGLAGRSIRATVSGVVTLARRAGSPALPAGVELTIDLGSLPAAHFLSTAARGERVSFRERDQRYRLDRPLLAVNGGEVCPTRIVNLSRRGCALLWPGPVPAEGTVLGLRLAGRLFPPVARAVVCWSSEGGPNGRRLGVRLVAAGRPARAWLRMARSAARRALRTE